MPNEGIAQPVPMAAGAQAVGEFKPLILIYSACNDAAALRNLQADIAVECARLQGNVRPLNLRLYDGPETRRIRGRRARAVHVVYIDTARGLDHPPYKRIVDRIKADYADPERFPQKVEIRECKSTLTDEYKAALAANDEHVKATQTASADGDALKLRLAELEAKLAKLEGGGGKK